MRLATTLAGSFPKLPTRPGDLNLRVVLNRRDQGKATQEDVRGAVRETTRRILGFQEEVGVDLPMDGSVGWEDAQTYFARGLEGIRIAGLIRYLDTNTYYRQPEIVGPVTWTTPITVDDFVAAKGLTKKPLKAFLPGPYSLLRFSKDLHYGNAEHAARALGEAVGREAAALERAGAEWIHFEEPWLGRATAADAAVVRGALEPALAGRTARTVIHVPFGAPTAIFDVIRELPWSVLGLDLVEAPAGWELIPLLPDGRGAALGLIDARNTRLEEAADIARLATRAATLRPDLELHLAPTASLEYLPADKAEAKVRRLVEAARLAAGNGGR